MVSDNQMFIFIRITILLKELNTSFSLASLPEVYFQGVHALPHSFLSIRLSPAVLYEGEIGKRRDSRSSAAPVYICDNEQER